MQSSSKPPKEMISISYETDAILHRTRPVIRINSSSVELIQTCKRKAFYSLKQGLKAVEESSATLFGTGIHKGLEAWYLASREERTSSQVRESVFAAFRNAVSALENLDITDKRHPVNGEKILTAYMEKYSNDPFEVLSDEVGPLVERRFEFTLLDQPDIKIIYFGTIDCILRNTETNTILVCDHKTTSSLGSEFYSRLNPNLQYRGYVVGAQRALKIQTNLFLVNGLQVAKTKTDLARQIIMIDDDAIEEFEDSVTWAVETYLHAMETGKWPQSSPSPCSMYGKCQFLDACAAPVAIREQILTNKFKTEVARG